MSENTDDKALISELRATHDCAVDMDERCCYHQAADRIEQLSAELLDERIKSANLAYQMTLRNQRLDDLDAALESVARRNDAVDRIEAMIERMSEEKT